MAWQNRLPCKDLTFATPSRKVWEQPFRPETNLVTMARLLSTGLLGFALAIPAAYATENRAYFSWNKAPRPPSCESASVQAAVAGTLARARTDYAGGRTITAIDGVREVAFQENQISPLARRFCRGTASLSDGSTHSVHYKLTEHGGFVGLSWAVEACLAPLDKWRVYGSYCSTTRPR
ncbi:hypothetical protein [Roseibium aquae]|nr:hypothetical protein [Roseibium aquae]